MAVLFVADVFLPIVAELRERAPDLRTIVHCGDGPTPDDLVPLAGFGSWIAGMLTNTTVVPIPVFDPVRVLRAVERHRASPSAGFTRHKA